MRATTALAWLFALAAGGLGAQNAIAVDNSYFDWQDQPALARFGEQYNPYYFSRESAGKRETLIIDRSLYWNRGGTLIREIKGQISGNELYVYASTQTNLAPETSIFAYVYTGRTPGQLNRYTLELLPSRRKDGGYVALWTRTGAIEAGELRNSSFTLEARIDLSRLPADLAADRARLSIDITSCYHEAASGTYEEFYFTTLYLGDLLAAR
jgi:hypothetical protein